MGYPPILIPPFAKSARRMGHPGDSGSLSALSVRSYISKARCGAPGEGQVEIESAWTARKRDRAAGRLCPGLELPHSSQQKAWMGHPPCFDPTLREKRAKDGAPRRFRIVKRSRRY